MWQRAKKEARCYTQNVEPFDLKQVNCLLHGVITNQVLILCLNLDIYHLKHSFETNPTFTPKWLVSLQGLSGLQQVWCYWKRNGAPCWVEWNKWESNEDNWEETPLFWSTLVVRWPCSLEARTISEALDSLYYTFHGTRLFFFFFSRSKIYWVLACGLKTPTKRGDVWVCMHANISHYTLHIPCDPVCPVSLRHAHIGLSNSLIGVGQRDKVFLMHKC